MFKLKGGGSTINTIKKVGLIALGASVIGVVCKLVVNENKKPTIQSSYEEEESFLIGREEYKRLKSGYEVLCTWLYKKNRGEKLADKLLLNNYKNVVIYGYGELGQRLYEELNGSEIHVSGVIDSSKFPMDTGEVEIMTLEDITTIHNFDVIVVTPIFDFDAIQENLLSRVNCKIISLQELMYR